MGAATPSAAGRLTDPSAVLGPAAPAVPSSGPTTRGRGGGAGPSSGRTRRTAPTRRARHVSFTDRRIGGVRTPQSGRGGCVRQNAHWCSAPNEVVVRVAAGSRVSTAPAPAPAPTPVGGHGVCPATTGAPKRANAAQ